MIKKVPWGENTMRVYGVGGLGLNLKVADS